MHMSDCLGGYDFYDSEHNLIPSKTQLSDTEIINVPHNLFVNNIELSMGYYLSSYTGESVLLYNYNIKSIFCLDREIKRKYKKNNNN